MDVRVITRCEVDANGDVVRVQTTHNGILAPPLGVNSVMANIRSGRTYYTAAKLNESRKSNVNIDHMSLEQMRADRNVMMAPVEIVDGPRVKSYIRTEANNTLIDNFENLPDLADPDS